MTLGPRHEARRIDGAPKLVAAPMTPENALSELRALRGHGPADVERYVERFLALRDDLAWRAARLQMLTETERAVLLAIDRILDGLDRGAEPLPDDVKQLVADVLRGH